MVARPGRSCGRLRCCCPRRVRGSRGDNAGKAGKREGTSGGYLWSDMLQPAFWIAVGQIIWINILLSGDNAVVIALACRSLPPQAALLGHPARRRRGGACSASSSPSSSPRSWASPFLKLVGGLLLLWIAVKLIVPSEEHGEEQRQGRRHAVARGMARDGRRHRDEPRQRHRDRGRGRNRGDARRRGACAGRSRPR